MLLADVPYEPSLFLSYQQETLARKSRFIRSGIMATNSAVETEFAKGGRTIDIPFFGDIDGSDEVLSDVTGLTPEGIAGDSQIGVRLMRGKSWKASNLAAELSGSDPMQAIAVRTASYWTRRTEDALISTLGGAFSAGGALASTHTFGGTSTDTTAGAFIDAVALLGDSGSELRKIAMHSKVYYKLIKGDLSVSGLFATSQIDTRVSQEDPEFESFLRRVVIVDDSLPFTVGTGTGGTNTYTSYLFADGAVSYAMAPAEVPYEVERDKFAGIDYLINRMHYMVHVNGLAWVGSASGNGPSNAELATVGNWEKRYSEDKNIKVVALQTYA